jgi:hypothetical protein
MCHSSIVGLIGAAVVAFSPDSHAADRPVAEKYLHAGQLAAGEKAILEELKRNPADDQARFGLGVLQFLRAVEHMGQSFYYYGLRSDRMQQVPLLRLPVPLNRQPHRMTYADARKILENLVQDLQKAETTLAAVRREDVKLPLRLAEVKLDFVGAGVAGESFRTLLARYRGAANTSPSGENRDLLVVFDRGDVAWLRGYCHLLMAMAEMALTFDGRKLFECTGHIFFAKIETPHKFLLTLKPNGESFTGPGGLDLVDIVAFIHLIRLPVAEPQRAKSAHAHLRQMLALSRESWKHILAETDDDHEWIPNPRQKGVLGVPVTQAMVDSWLEFVDEAEALLDGKRLAPFWRGDERRGVNLRRAFFEPRPFDLVLWVQGTAATPYLDSGPLTKREVWDRLRDVFRGQFFGIALWFN